MSLTIACIQLDIAFGDPKKNKGNVQLEIENLLEKKPDIIVLPELWTTGYDLTRLEEIADSNGTDTKKFISELSQRYSVSIVAGSVAKKTESGVTNTMYVCNRQGQIVSEYSKLHLFRLMDEHLYLQPGEAEGMFVLEDTVCAGFICYDIRFPEWLRLHACKGAEIMFVVAEWPLPRLHHWRTLLQARAIENQCYVIACNRAGKDPNNTFAGHSMIIDPWGEIICEADKGPGTIIAQIDLDQVKEVRNRIPVFSDRRPDRYHE